MRTQTSKTQDSTKAKPVSSQRSSTPHYSHPVLQLQQKIGNQAVQRLLQSRHIQARLTVGKPDDKYEQEADRVADQVMRMPDSTVQHQPEPEEDEEVMKKQEDEEEEKTVETIRLPHIQKSGGDQSNYASPDMSRRLASAKGSGAPASKAQ